MTDPENRFTTALTEALTQGADDAPRPVGLAAAARSRARARRRTRLAGVAAVVALGVGVPAVVVAAQGSHGEVAPAPSKGDVATDPDATGPQVPGGFHYESWHDVSVLVPDSWGYGSLSDWCARGGSPGNPLIERPGTVTDDILCSPGSTYGLSFQEIDNTDDFQWPLTHQTGESWPADNNVGAHGIGGVLVQVDLPDRDLAQRILDSVKHNDVLDPNGCPVDTGSDPAFPASSMVVCRYDAGGELEQSELLNGKNLEEAEHTLNAAPAVDGPEPCQPDDGQLVRLASVSEDALLAIEPDCAHLTVNGLERQVTSEVLYWALSPGWSGSVPAGVSLPSRLRGQ